MTPEQEALARTLITTTMHRYASLARENCDWDGIAACFGPSNAIYRLPNGTAIDPAKAKEVVRGNEAPYIRHHITSIDIQFVSDEEAHSEAFFFAATNYTFTDHWGAWKDVFRKQTDGRWLIKERTITVDGYAKDSWVAEVWGDAALVTGVNGKGEK